ncbi:MAG: hypothetical protein AVDCRST_MAG88-4407 [uncultured Thermomicrobiales bacterium]|uniref:Uncharacterized protein n=1 Tax=uncultured Thermomicrobiales bacterium TaxID=1645740 RepID=A0A6J4VTC5_9BACT|nr:MAG: hypothetical protein AVDCRST_MAG88-4407 [uncultured Thermomicrobiales bacterium]
MFADHHAGNGRARATNLARARAVRPRPGPPHSLLARHAPAAALW